MTEREVMAELVRFVGVLTYGKERWFKQNGCWYDRLCGDCIQNEVLLERITEAINDENADRPTGEWTEVYAETDYCNGWIEFSCECCGHQHGLESGEYGWSYGEPIPWKFCPLCGAKMRGEEE